MDKGYRAILVVGTGLFLGATAYAVTSKSDQEYTEPTDQHRYVVTRDQIDIRSTPQAGEYCVYAMTDRPDGAIHSLQIMAGDGLESRFIFASNVMEPVRQESNIDRLEDAIVSAEPTDTISFYGELRDDGVHVHSAVVGENRYRFDQDRW